MEEKCVQTEIDDKTNQNTAESSSTADEMNEPLDLNSFKDKIETFVRQSKVDRATLKKIFRDIYENFPKQ